MQWWTTRSIDRDDVTRRSRRIRLKLNDGRIRTSIVRVLNLFV